MKSKLIKHFVFHSFNDKPSIKSAISKTIIWHKDGKLHRDNNPAVVISENECLFYKNGRIQLEGI